MKICPFCQSQNPDSAVLCTECMNSIGGIKPEPENHSDEILNALLRKEERKEKRQIIIERIALIIYFAVSILAYLFVIINKGAFYPLIFVTLLFGLMYYLCVFKPRFLFMLEHISCIDNIDDVEISDWYFISNKIGGFCCLLIGIGLAIYTCIKSI